MDNEHSGRSYGHQYVPANYDPNRPKLKRPTTDYGATLAQWARYRKPRDKRSTLLEAERPSHSYIVDILPPLARPHSAADSIPARHLHSSLNKAKYPINVTIWTPEGRRLLTASSSGEFTLWNGMSFNFELIMQAHESAVRSACYSHSEDWLISADQDGIVKYWQPNFNNVKEIQAHNETIRGLVFSPTDTKFATASDDATIKIFDFAGGIEESVMTGHQWEIRSLDWHPTKGLLVSGSKDHSVKLWDPRSGRCLTTLNSSKNQVSRTMFEKTEGLFLATAGRDQIIRIFDLRMMRDVFHLRGHENEITSLAWHPLHRNLISTGGHSGAIHHYLLDEPNPGPNGAYTLSPYDSPDPQNAPTQTIFPAHSIFHAHEPTGPIWAMAWHPLGHILASGSNDRVTRFWTRPRPGETNYLMDRFHIGSEAAEARGTYNKQDRFQQKNAEEQEEEDEADGLAEQKVPAPPLQFPGMQLPGIGLPGLTQLPGFGAVAPPTRTSNEIPNPSLPGPWPAGAPLPPNTGMLPPGMDLEKLKEMFGGQLPPFPPNGMPFPPLPAGFPPPPNGFPMPLPGMPGAPMPGFMPGTMPPFPPPIANGGTPGPDTNGNGIRKRGPLPSQEEAKRQLFGR